MRRWIGVMLVLMVFVAGCRIGGPAPKADLDIPLPPAFKGQVDPAGSVAANWLAHFNDAQLSALVAEALAHNHDLKAAAARLELAEAQVVRAGAGRKPAIGVEGTGNRDRSIKHGDKRNHRRGVWLDVSWELDVWGRIADLRDAAHADFQATALDYRFARQSLAARVAKAWFAAVTSKAQVSLGDSFVQNYSQQLELTRLRYEAGEASRQDLSLIRAERANAHQEYVQARMLHEADLRHLELLVGRYPGAEIAVAETLADLDMTIPAGLPADLLTRRPDVAAAWQRVWAAHKNCSATAKARLPKLSLTSRVGAVSTTLKELVSVTTTDRLLSLAANLLAPIYEGGRLAADVRIADAAQKEALAQYAKVALTAFAEVESALSSANHLKERIAYLQEMVEETHSALELVRLEVASGESDMLRQLVVQLRVNTARTTWLQARYARLDEAVNLFLALGGGFDTQDSHDEKKERKADEHH